MTAISDGPRRRIARRFTDHAAALTLAVTAIAASTTARAVADAPAQVVDADRAPITAITPARYWDTRVDAATPMVDDRFAPMGSLAAGQRVAVPVAGRGEVPADAVAAIVNLTVIDPGSTGSALVFPCGRRPPTVPLLRIVAGDTRSNSAMVALGRSGDVCVRADTTADFALDVTGYVLAGSPIAVFDATRVFDTADRLPATSFASAAPVAPQVAAGSVVEIEVAGRGRVPADADGAFVNVTASSSAEDGTATVFPCDSRSAVPTVAFAADSVVSAATVVALSSTGTICLSATADVDVAVDVLGAIPRDAAGVLRVAPPVPFAGATIGAGQTVEVDVAGPTGLSAGAAAAFVTLGIDDAESASEVTVFPCGPQPAVPRSSPGATPAVGRRPC